MRRKGQRIGQFGQQIKKTGRTRHVPPSWQRDQRVAAPVGNQRPRLCGDFIEAVTGEQACLARPRNHTCAAAMRR